MEDGRVSLADIVEVRGSGLESAELLAVLCATGEYLTSKKASARSLFSPEQICITEKGRVEVNVADEVPHEYIPPENRANPHEAIFDHQLVWCLGEVAKVMSRPDSDDAGLFSLINLMTVEHVGTRPTMQKLWQITRNKIANPESIPKVLLGLYQEVMGNIEDLADDSDVDSLHGQPHIIVSHPPPTLKVAQVTQASSSASSAASESRSSSSVDENENRRLSSVSDDDQAPVQPTPNATEPRNRVQPPQHKPTVSSQTSESLSRITEESGESEVRSIRPKTPPRQPTPPLVAEPRPVVGRYLKRTEVQEQHRYVPQAARRSNVEERLEDDAHQSSGELSNNSPLSHSTTSSPSVNNAREEVPVDVPPKSAPLHRQNSLRPSRGQRGSMKHQQVKVKATPEFVEKAKSPTIRLRAQSLKRRRVSLHRAEQTLLYVKLVNGQAVELNCRSDVLVGNIFDTVVSHLNLNENNFFGLAMMENGEFFFLDNDQRVEKYAPSGWRTALKNNSSVDFVLFLRFKFYPRRPDFIKTPIALHELYLQLRQNILEGTLQHSRGHLLEVGALALQAEFGDKPPHVTNYFDLENYIPSQILSVVKPDDIKDALIRLHATHQSLSKAEAERLFIGSVQQWPIYGAHFYMVHKFKPSARSPIDNRFQAHQWLGVMPHGVGICKEVAPGTKEMGKVHEWHMIRTLQYDGKRFLLATMENNIAVDHVFYLEHFTKSRYLVRFAAAQHKFMLRMRHWQSTLQRNKVTGEDVIVERDSRSQQTRPQRPRRDSVDAAPQTPVDLVEWTDRMLEEIYDTNAQKLRITLEKNPEHGLGLTLVDGKVNGVNCVYVKSVSEDGDGKRKGLNMGDCILSIDGTSLCNKTRHDAVNIVRRCGNEVLLEVLRFHSITAVLSAEKEKKKEETRKPEEPEHRRQVPPTPPAASTTPSDRSATLGRAVRTPPPARKAAPVQSYVNRRQRAVSDFGAIGDTLPSLNSDDLLQSMEQLSRSRRRVDSASTSEDESPSAETKGHYTLPVASMYDFHRETDENDSVSTPHNANPDQIYPFAQNGTRTAASNKISDTVYSNSLPRPSNGRHLDWTLDLAEAEVQDEPHRSSFNNSPANPFSRRLVVQLKRIPGQNLGFRMATGHGVVRVKQVTSDPAKAAGLKEDDEIISINGQDVKGLIHQDVVNLLHNSGNVVRIVVERSEMPADDEESLTIFLNKPSSGSLGLSLAKRTGHEGVYIRTIALGSVAHDEGSLKVGDRILSVNGVDVSDQTPSAIVEILKNVSDDFSIVVSRPLFEL